MTAAAVTVNTPWKTGPWIIGWMVRKEKEMKYPVSKTIQENFNIIIESVIFFIFLY